MRDTKREPSDETVSVDVRIDRLCDRFEYLLLAGQPVSVADFLRNEGLDPEEVARNLLLELDRLAAYYHPDHRPTAAGPHTGGDETADVSAGTVLAGRYELLEKIGGGGMGDVWMAQQTAPVRRLVAVKVIKAGMDTKAVLARFDAERQTLAMMDHDNIARVFDAGTTPAGRPYFVMELVKGVPITTFCDARKLPPRERLHLFVSVCEAIQHAHLKGVVHRDIKPGNVLVALYDGKPVVKVIDFGIAKATGQSLTDRTLFTGFGAVVGTPEYMSPEQAGLNNLDVDTRSDVYSLGVLLYELLTGRTPVDRKSLERAALDEVLRIVREVDAPRPSHKLSTVDGLPSIAANRSTEPAKLVKLFRGELDWVLLKALEKDRGRRYQSANAFVADVRNYLADEVVDARPPNRGYRLRKFVLRNRSAAVASAAVFVALLGGVLGTTLGLLEANRQAKEANVARGKADASAANANTARLKEQDAKEVAQREKRNALAVAASSGLDQAQQVCEGGNVVRGLHLMLKALPPAIESGDAAIEDAVRSTIAAWLPHANRLLGHVPDVVNHAAMDTSGKRMVIGSHDGWMGIWDATDGAKLSRNVSLGAEILQVAWQPGGETIAVLCRDGSLRLWAAGAPVGNARTVRLCGPIPAGIRGSLSFTPDGTKVLVGAAGQSAVLVDVAKAVVVAPALYHGSTHCDAVAVSPDGTKAVVATPDWSARVHDLATGHPLTPAIRTHGLNRCTGISPDGTKFFTGHDADASIQVWDMTTGAAAGPRLAAGGPVLCAAFSPDGRHLVVGGWMSFVRMWDWKAGTPVGSPIPQRTNSVAITSDGKRLLTAAFGASVWQLPDRDLIWSGERLPGAAVGFAFRPDSGEFAVTTSDHSIRSSAPSNTSSLLRYTAATGEAIRPSLSPPQGQLGPGLRYSTDGSTLFSAQAVGVTEYDVVTGREVRRLTPPDARQRCEWVDLTSDGQYLAAGGAGTFAVYDRARQQWTHQTAYRKNGRTSCGFLPGSKTLLGFLGGDLLAWDVTAADKLSPVTRCGTPLGYCSHWTPSPDGRTLALVSGSGNMLELDTTTDRPSGLMYGNLKASPPSYSQDGRWLFVADQSGYAARHRATRKRLGPYYTDVDGLVLGVTPDGKAMISLDSDRRLRCWRVPVPMSGSPTEVSRRVVERIGVEEHDGGFLGRPSLYRTSSTGADRPPLPVFDSRELHNADLDEMKKWFATLPKTHRPIQILVQGGSEDKRFDALAIDDGTGTGFDARLGGSTGVDDKAMWAEGWVQAIRVAYFPPGSSGLNHVVWVKWVRTRIAWKERDVAVTEFRSQRLRPIGIVQFDDTFFMNGGPDDGLKWELHHGLTAAQVAEKIEEARKRKWRPTLVHRHRSKADVFALVLVDNPNGTAWEYHAPLNLKEYEAKLADAKGRGLRPEYVHSWVVDKEPVYSAVLVGDYRPPPPTAELAPLPRLAK